METKTLSVLFTCLFTGLALLQPAQAISPPPDGGYPGGNTAEGQNALFGVTSGGYNTAGGFFSLRSDTTGSFNTGFGAGALFANNADQNCAFGTLALFGNSGPSNSAFGYSALMSNTANANAAFGAYSLLSNTTGNFNTASGFAALQSNTSGVQNTADGSGALLLNTTGSYNTAVGVNTLLNTQGNDNIAIGYLAGQNITGSHNILIGNVGDSADNNNIRIGSNNQHIYIEAIGNIAFAGIPVVWDPMTSVLGQSPSSRRFKKDIRPINDASDTIFALTPVSFRYTEDPGNTRCFGLIADR